MPQTFNFAATNVQGEPSPISVTYYPSGIVTASAVVDGYHEKLKFVAMDGEYPEEIATDFAESYNLTMDEPG